MRTNVALLVAIVTTLLLALTSCKTTKYQTCDAYKTHYKAVKAEKHHHTKCDAYN